MKTKSLMIAVLMVFAASSVFAATLSFTPKGGGIVDITVDQAQGIAGAAFTVTYDKTKVTLIEVTSTFFETFATQKSKVTTWTSAIPTAAELGGYDQPLLHSDIATTSVTGTAIAAARFNGADAAANATLFTLTFQRNTGVTDKTFPLSIIATTLSNTNAGYSASGETINLLVGADATKAVTDAAAFPVILAKSTSAAASGDVKFGFKGGDATGDGSVSSADALRIIRCAMGKETDSTRCLNVAAETADVTGDGQVTSADALRIIRCAMGKETDPTRCSRINNW